MSILFLQNYLHTSTIVFEDLTFRIFLSRPCTASLDNTPSPPLPDCNCKISILLFDKIVTISCQVVLRFFSRNYGGIIICLIDIVNTWSELCVMLKRTWL